MSIYINRGQAFRKILPFAEVVNIKNMSYRLKLAEKYIVPHYLRRFKDRLAKVGEGSMTHDSAYYDGVLCCSVVTWLTMPISGG